MRRIEHTHSLDLHKAIASLQLLSRDLEEKYSGVVGSYSARWVSDHELEFSVGFRGCRVKGKIGVNSTQAWVEYDLPFLFKLQGKEIERRIIGRFERYF